MVDRSLLVVVVVVVGCRLVVGWVGVWLSVGGWLAVGRLGGWH